MPRSRAVYLVDGSAQVHRAYFAVRSLTTSRGLPTGASYGFTSMLRKLLEDEAPEWIGMSFDLPGPTFRHQQYAAYKANRPRMEDDLVVQMPFVRRVCQAFRVPVLECPGFEADDVIATLTRQARERGLEVVVVSGDKDLLQLVGEGVFVLNPGREGAAATLYDAKGVEEKFGVPPERVVDVLALMGDATDNVPGVAGIGEKGARDLVRSYGSLEAVLANAENVKRAAYREGLRAHRQDALLSKELVTLRTDAPVTLDLEALRRQPPDRSAAYALFGELEFQALAHAFAPETVANPATTQVRLVGGPADLERLAAEARRTGRLAMAMVTTAGEAMRAEIRGLALAAEPGGASYLPLAHSRLELPDPPEPEAALAALRPLLADARVAKLSARGKHEQVVLARRGVRVQGLALDALLAAFLVNPGRRSYSLEELGDEYLGERLAEGDAAGLAGAGLEQAARAACQQADLLLRLEAPLLRRLEDDGLSEVYRNMELPLVAILAEMEQAGVKLDIELLGEMSREMEQRIAGLTREVHGLAKGEFNLNSPAQLREVLFDRLGLQQGKKTSKTRAASTAEDVLEELAASHPLPGKILEYRTVQKLKSTYVDALPALVHPQTGRVHSRFSQTAAATGRLSSSDPNLQNIPIRTAEGRRIREAFVAEPGHLLLSADYSQIELRVLAHLSGDATLIEGFRRGEDVHERTARELFGPFSTLPADEQRRRSKMVNYALLYGKTAFSLARDLGVTRKDADRFIEDYFARYPRVRLFFDETVARAREHGFVRTLLGRLRRLPDLQARNFQVRMEAERQARNTPVQGSAADLIKKAMIDLHRELGARRMASRLVLQIHDELLLEVPEAEAETAKGLVRSVMEGALDLAVPLVADTRLGRNWAEAH
jgi:DNA polymerase-1